MTEMSLVLNNFTKNLFTTKSSAYRSRLHKLQAKSRLRDCVGAAGTGRDSAADRQGPRHVQSGGDVRAATTSVSPASDADDAAAAAASHRRPRRRHRGTFRRPSGPR